MLTSKQLMAKAHITYRQLDHWSRVGYLQAGSEGQGSGVWRQFAETEIPVAILMRSLSDADMLGSSGRGRQTTYLAPLIDHVRANGLTGQFTLDCNYLILDLDALVDE